MFYIISLGKLRQLKFCQYGWVCVPISCRSKEEASRCVLIGYRNCCFSLEDKGKSNTSNSSFSPNKVRATRRYVGYSNFINWEELLLEVCFQTSSYPFHHPVL